MGGQSRKREAPSLPWTLFTGSFGAPEGQVAAPGGGGGGQGDSSPVPDRVYTAWILEGSPEAGFGSAVPPGPLSCPDCSLARSSKTLAPPAHPSPTSGRARLGLPSSRNPSAPGVGGDLGGPKGRRGRDVHWASGRGVSRAPVPPARPDSPRLARELCGSPGRSAPRDPGVGPSVPAGAVSRWLSVPGDGVAGQGSGPREDRPRCRWHCRRARGPPGHTRSWGGGGGSERLCRGQPKGARHGAGGPGQGQNEDQQDGVWSPFLVCYHSSDSSPL